METTALFAARVGDARYLLDALAGGDIGSSRTVIVDPADIETLHAMTLTATLDQALAADRARFDDAMRRVTRALSPVTIQSLKDTDDRLRSKPWWWVKPVYRAKRLTIALMFFSFLFVGAAIFGEIWVRYLGKAAIQPDPCLKLMSYAIEVMTPFTYGALGAAVYLLRWLHVHLYERTFDRRRGPEYINRVILGSIAGGAIVMFVDQFVDDKGKVVALSAAALGFLAGYNTDLLFSAIERITSAILPKIGIDSVRKRGDAEAAAEAETALLKQLTDQLAKAQTAQEKADIMKLIERIVPKK